MYKSFLHINDPTTSLLASSCLLSFQRYVSINKIALVLTFLLCPSILLLFFSHSKSPILLLLSLPLLFSPSLVFSFLPSSFVLFLFISFLSHLFFLFCFYHSSSLYFSFYYFPHSSEHFIIFTSLVFQSISGLWQASHDISKITLHFCLLIILISVFFLYP